MWEDLRLSGTLKTILAKTERKTLLGESSKVPNPLFFVWLTHVDLIWFPIVEKQSEASKNDILIAVPANNLAEFVDIVFQTPA